jgi:hypothetical protein
MAKLIDSPAHWLERAEEARIISEDMQDAESRRIVLGIAEVYEKLAKRAQERLSPQGRSTGG